MSREWKAIRREDYKVNEEMTVEQMKEEIQELRFKKELVVQELLISYMERWSNEACKGYMIKALEQENFKSNDIQKIIDGLRWIFDETSIEEAKEIYLKSEY